MTILDTEAYKDDDFYKTKELLSKLSFIELRDGIKNIFDTLLVRLKEEHNDMNMIVRHLLSLNNFTEDLQDLLTYVSQNSTSIMADKLLKKGE